MAHQALPGFSCFAVAEGVLRTWSSVCEGERRPVDLADAFESGAWEGGNRVPTGEGFILVDLLEKRDEVANLVGPSLIGKRVEQPPLIRGNTEHIFTLDFGDSVSAFPHFKPTTTA